MYYNYMLGFFTHISLFRFDTQQKEAILLNLATDYPNIDFYLFSMDLVIYNEVALNDNELMFQS